MFRGFNLLGSLLILWLSLPLALLAMVSTILAFSTLFLRAATVYIELVVALVDGWLMVTPLSTGSSQRGKLLPRPTKDGNQRDSQKSRQTIIELPATNDSTLISPGRDFEGVGGWSLSNRSTTPKVFPTNSLLELPSPTVDTGRHHRRAYTGGSVRMVKSPLSARTVSYTHLTLPTKRIV